MQPLPSHSHSTPHRSSSPTIPPPAEASLAQLAIFQSADQTVSPGFPAVTNGEHTHAYPQLYSFQSPSAVPKHGLRFSGHLRSVEDPAQRGHGVNFRNHNSSLKTSPDWEKMIPFDSHNDVCTIVYPLLSRYLTLTSGI